MMGATASFSLRDSKALTTELQSDLAARWNKLSQSHRVEAAVHKRKRIEVSTSDQPIYTLQRAEGDGETGTEVSDSPRLHVECSPKEARVYPQM